MVNSHSWAEIDLDALRHNLAKVREYAPGKRVCAVIKANAYGHGVVRIAEALSDDLNESDLVAVATLNEALSLQQSFKSTPVLVLRGPLDMNELNELIQQQFHWTLHSTWQAELLKVWLETHVDQRPAINIWFKINTGMNRLGLTTSDLKSVWSWVQSLQLPGERVLMSHFATADEMDHPLTPQQLNALQQMTAPLQDADDCPRSISASAGILWWPDAHQDIIRPGIMLYGASPMGSPNGLSFGLRPVMTLKSRLLTINQMSAGSPIGYGATYQCPEDMPVGVIGIGYGDGYPRHVAPDTPVMIFANNQVWEAPLIGRVSMDVLTVDLRGIPAQPGDEVMLWGQSWGHHLPVETIAEYAGTIGYELFCQITSRVQFFNR